MAEGAGNSMNEVSLFHLYVLRFFFAVLAIAEGATQVRLFLHHEHWAPTSGIAHSFLLALAVLSIVGVRYPLQMLPLLIYEILWKMIWVLGFALPLWLANQFDADTRKAFFEIAPVVILIPFIPWRYVFAKYVVQPGDRWASRTSR